MAVLQNNLRFCLPDKMSNVPLTSPLVLLTKRNNSTEMGNDLLRARANPTSMDDLQMHVGFVNLAPLEPLKKDIHQITVQPLMTPKLFKLTHF